MAKIDFSKLNQTIGNAGHAPEASNSTNISFFSLKNDGDEAVVRFIEDSTNSFEILASHQIALDGKQRKVNCIREAHQPLQACPLCAKGEKTLQRFFIKLIEYSTGPDGSVVATPKVWERSSKYAYTLRDLMNEYGALSESLFKVKRQGAAGSTDTSYQIMYCSPMVYKNENYPKLPEAFTNYSALGRVVLDKSFSDLETFIATGKFPAQSQQPTVESNPSSMGTTNSNQFSPAWGANTTPSNTETDNLRPTRYYTGSNQ